MVNLMMFAMSPPLFWGTVYHSLTHFPKALSLASIVANSWCMPTLALFLVPEMEFFFFLNTASAIASTISSVTMHVNVLPLLNERTCLTFTFNIFSPDNWNYSYQVSEYSTLTVIIQISRQGQEHSRNEQNARCHSACTGLCMNFILLTPSQDSFAQ